MTAKVPRHPTNIDSIGIKSGLPVTGSQWGSLARIVNWIVGRGGSLVTACCYGKELAAGANQTFRFYISPRHQGLYHLWVVTMRGGDRALGIFTPNGGAAKDWYISGDDVETLFFLESVAQSRTPAESYCNIELYGGSVDSAYIYQIALYELPRTVLELGSDHGPADLATVSHGQVIRTSADGDQSVEGVSTGLITAKDACRRNGHFYWYYPPGIPITTVDYPGDNLFPLSPEVCGRKIYADDDAPDGTQGRTLTWRIYGKTSTAGRVGTVKLETTSGESTTVTLSSTSAGWSAAAEIDVDCEDLSADDGRRDTTWEELDFNAKIDTAGSTFTLYGISVYEADATLP
jgi:hypothetical protein